MPIDPHIRELTRRRFLSLSAAGGAGTLSLGGLLQAGVRAQENGATVKPKIRACIFVFYYGGPSHLDTYDLKPQASENVRGEFKSIATSVPGLRICEHLPNMAKVMHKCALVQSMHHTNNLHDSASIETHTGRQAAQGDREEFAPIEQFFPCHGSTLSYLWRDKRLTAPHAALPFMFHNVVDVPCQAGGFLGSAYQPFRITGDPLRKNYDLKELSPGDALPAKRIQSRFDLLSALEKEPATPGKGAVGFRPYYERAHQLLSSEKTRRALDLTEESDRMRERYGMYSTVGLGGGNGADKGYFRHMRGQNLLVARRLVEAGVPFVNVYDFRQQGQNWDSHAQNFAQHKDFLLPPAEKALAALIGDLDERGLLDSTLVVAAGEFGRTPRINKDAGRDHWPNCYTVLLAGGGVQGGAVLGASDAVGAYPAKDPVTPADLAATIYWRFGFEPDTLIYDRVNRPWPIAAGQPFRTLFGSV